MALFLTTSSDGSTNALGIGAVSQWHLITYCIAKELGINVSISPYTNVIGYEYSGYSNEEWNNSFTKFFNFDCTSDFDEELLFSGQYEDLLNFVNQERNSSRKILIDIPFTTLRRIGEPRLPIFYENGYLKEVKNNLAIDRKLFATDNLNISFHIRTINPGDVECEIKNPDREYCSVKDNFHRYNNIVTHIRNLHPDEKIRLHIHSQGNVDDYIDFLNLEDHQFETILHLNEHPIMDIYQMSISDYLIMANSSYSWVSHLLNFNKSFVRNNFWHPTYPSTIKLDYNYNPI